MSFWKRAVCVVLLAALLPVSLLLTGLALPEYYGESYYAELPAMYEKLRTTQGRKIVIVGGSNVAFGVDIELLELLLSGCGYDYTVCTFGLYAAVGTSAMLELSRDCLGEEDLVVLAIEPTSETFSTYFGATAFWKCAESSPELLPGLNARQRGAVIGNYLDYLQQRLEIARTGILPGAQGVYGKASFDGQCSMVYDRAGNMMPLGYDTGNPIDLSAVEFQPEFVQQLCDYCRDAGHRGAEVVMSFSPMNRSAMTDGWEKTVYGYFLRCQESFPCPVISDPNDYILDSGWFYDSNFHLNSPGAQVRTAQLAADLLSYLGCYQAIRFQMPGMPPSIARMEYGGGDGDAFLFQPLEDGGWLVSGLTERGKTAASLAVPSSYEGKPVVGITDTAFAGASTLEELTLPASIERIPDGAFSGCGNLIRLVLLHTQKPPDIGKAPFAGADGLRIFVPSDAYTMYRDGAGCAANPWEAYLGRIGTF